VRGKIEQADSRPDRPPGLQVDQLGLSRSGNVDPPEMAERFLTISVRPIVPTDSDAWEKMRRCLWPDDPDSHTPEIAAFFAGQSIEPLSVLVAEDTAGGMVGFAELSIRTDLAGVEGERVGYVEGLFVSPDARHRRIARTLLQASRAWAREQGCTAFASDRADRIIIDKSFSAFRK
jgi:aminoglycoside 6'-N-acetyltransferase I